MNERIKELVVKSGNGQFHDGKCYPHIGSRTLEDWSKFAELIVQECIAICKDVDGEDNIDARSGRQDCAVEIQEHFGVE